MQRRDRVRLRHMVEAAEAAQRFVEGRNRPDLDSDQMFRFALVRAVEIVGEAAGKVSAETRIETPGIPWNTVIGMRNRLVHVYFEINLDILWTTATQALPPLLAYLKSLPLED